MKGAPTSMQTAASTVGRDMELASLVRFLDALPSGPRLLLMRGEAGIGKTTLWSEGIAAAVAASYQVLACGAVEPETKLPYAGLADLLRDVGDEILEELPEPQRRALDVALLRAEAQGPLLEQRAISAAVLGTLASLARSQPVLVAVDDVRWLDGPTERVLRYALRRLHGMSVGVLLTERGADEPVVPLDLGRAFPEDRIELMSVGPLAAEAIDRLLRDRLGLSLPKSTLLQLHRDCGGNPFYALEIGRALLERGTLLPGEALPVPATLNGLVGTRLARLSRATREVVFAASALSAPTADLLEGAFGERRTAAGLSKAVEAGVIKRETGRIVFTHPLLRSVLYSEASPERRRRLHRRLAQVLSDAEERARHLALAAEGPDPEVATLLDEAARSAHARGAPDAAAQLAEMAERLTPPDRGEDAGARSLKAGKHYHEVGDVARARELLERAAALLPSGILRANALLILGYIALEYEPARAALDRFQRAREEAGEDPDLLCDVEQGLAWLGYLSGDCVGAAAHARTAVTMAERGTDPVMLAEALGTLAVQGSALGEGIRIDLLERVELGIPLEHERTVRGSAWILGMLLLWAGRLEEARRVLETELEAAYVRGDEDILTEVLPLLAEVELRAGSWAKAAERADEGCEAARWCGMGGGGVRALSARALVRAHLGHVEAAAADIREALEICNAIAGDLWALDLTALLGFIELSLGNSREAHLHLEDVVERAGIYGLREPALTRFVPDEIETLVTLGELGRAERRLLPFERRARKLDRAWALATAARCRGLVAASRGDMSAAFRSLERALKEHERLSEPFELARTLLVFGSIQRRAKQKRAARELLGRALAIFEQLGATLWAAKARAELRRIGGRTPSPLALSPTEERIVELVTDGLTNREVADALFLSVRTVEGNLTRIYRKVGVSSRRELARRDRARQGPRKVNGSA